jgi:hypothetical protein
LKTSTAITLLVLMAVVPVSCNRVREPAKLDVTPPARHMWPPLPATGFITGRKATQDDVAKGDAAFFLGMSEPLTIEIPQYAYHVEEKTGKRTAGIVVQAERTPDGKDLVAIHPVEGGGHLVGMLGEFKLLGKVPPKGD